MSVWNSESFSTNVYFFVEILESQETKTSGAPISEKAIFFRQQYFKSKRYIWAETFRVSYRHIGLRLVKVWGKSTNFRFIGVYNPIESKFSKLAITVKGRSMGTYPFEVFHTS